MLQRWSGRSSRCGRLILTPPCHNAIEASPLRWSEPRAGSSDGAPWWQVHLLQCVRLELRRVVADAPNPRTCPGCPLERQLLAQLVWFHILLGVDPLKDLLTRHGCLPTPFQITNFRHVCFASRGFTGFGAFWWIQLLQNWFLVCFALCRWYFDNLRCCSFFQRSSIIFRFIVLKRPFLGYPRIPHPPLLGSSAGI
jgi:hypothetical protein